MTKRLFIKLMICVFTLSASAAYSQTLEKNLNDLVLEDVWGNVYELKQLEGNNVILITSSKETRNETKKILETLRPFYKENDSIFFIIMLNGLKKPFFVTKEMIRKEIRKENLKRENSLLLLDWDLKTTEKLCATIGKTDIFVFNRNGRLSKHWTSGYSDEIIEQIKNQIFNDN